MAESTTIGIDWPVGSGGKTTQTNKAVFAAAARGAGEEQLAKGIENEKDWRFGYIPHLQRLGAKLAGEKCLELAGAALDKLYESFVLRDADGTTRTLKEANAAPPASQPAFQTEVVTGKAEAMPELKVPYEGKMLGEEELGRVLGVMSAQGTHEKDVDQKVLEMAKVDLKGRWFALLGAGSELGPFRFLMEHGANVIAVRTRKQTEWQKMKEFAEASCGNLYIPVSGTGEYGADLLLEPVQIRDWIFSVVSTQPGVDELTVGAYTYLDGEANVRVGLGCDLVMTGLEKLLPNTKVRVAFLGSISISCAITPEMYKAIDQNRAESPCWMRATGCPPPAHEIVDGRHMMHGFVNLQGPNYALAKTLIVWRVLLAKHVSYNNGPPCRTANMVKNPTLKIMLESSSLVKPNQAQDAPFASQIMGRLLAYDVVVGKPAPEHPLDKTVSSSFHGGTLRMGFNIEAGRVLQSILYLYGRCCMKR